MEVILKLFLESFKNKSHIVNMNDQINKTKTKVNLPHIPLPSFKNDYSDFANFKRNLLTLLLIMSN